MRPLEWNRKINIRYFVLFRFSDFYLCLLGKQFMIGLQFIHNAAIKYGAYLLLSSGFLSHAHLSPNALSKHKQKHRQTDSQTDATKAILGLRGGCVICFAYFCYWLFGPLMLLHPSKCLHTHKICCVLIFYKYCYFPKLLNA